MSSIRVGKPAPAFNAVAVKPDLSFENVTLDTYKGKYVLFLFYPLDWTFVCPTEIVEFSDKAKAFREAGCEVVAISTDSQFSHYQWLNTDRKNGGLGKLDIDLISDLSREMSEKYGVLMDDGFCLRGSVLVSDTGVVRYIQLNDRPVGRSADETLRLLQAFKFVDEHGEVCPASWRPGGKTIKTDPTQKLEYFRAVNGADGDADDGKKRKR